MSAIKKVPIGIEDFKNIIDKNCYFVDKTLMIKDLLDSGADVTLFTRLRRFGKTLNLSMIQRFFEKMEESNAYLLDKMVDLIRSVFESALKTNSSLEYGILTGCLRDIKGKYFYRA